MRANAALLLAGLILACGRSPGSLAASGEWPAIPYAPQAPDGPSRGIHEDEEAKQIQAGLQARYGEPIELTWVSRETFSAPGWPGGAAGRFEAHPKAHPELHFGGFNGHELVDNYDCVRAVQPVLDWVAEHSDARTLGAEHRCEHSAKQENKVRLWLFDDSARPLEELVPELQEELNAVLSASIAGPQPLASLGLRVSVQPPGSGPTVRQVVTTSRRGEHARHWAQRRELASAELQWSAGDWSVKTERPTRVRVVEEQALTALASGKPSNVAFSVERLGPADATIEDIARRESVREGVNVHVRVDGEYDTKALRAWVKQSQDALDERLLFHWHFTLCKQGAARPWAPPEDCQAGWDAFTLFTLDKAREAPEYWPYPPPFD